MTKEQLDDINTYLSLPDKEFETLFKESHPEVKHLDLEKDALEVFEQVVKLKEASSEH